MSTQRPLSAASSSIADTDASSDSGSSAMKDILFEEPMFHVLGQFLVSGNKNIADILLDLTKEVTKLRVAMEAAAPK